MLVLTIFFTLFGLIIGSFLNVCIYRIPRNESISYPPSHCTNCGNRIQWYDLFPVLSYLLLRGRCRYCGERISFKYPIIELITGVLFGSLYIEYGFSFFYLIKFMVLIAFILVIGIIDLETSDVYFKTTLPGIIMGIVLAVYGYYLGGSFLEYLYGGLLGGGFISLIILLTRGMGWGDVEICLLGGLFLGLRLSIVMLLSSFIIGGITGVILMLLKKKTRRDYMPFGPSIAAAVIFTVFFGERIVSWYLSLL